MLETNTSFGAEWRTVEKFWQEQERSTHLAVIELTAWNLIDIPGVQAHRRLGTRIQSLRLPPQQPHHSDLNTRG